MNNEFEIRPDTVSTTQVELVLDESWLDKMIAAYASEIPVNEKFTLNNLKVNIGEGLLHIEAGLKGKEGSKIELSTRPTWLGDEQRMILDDVKFKTDTNNVLLKSAGFFAQLFLGSTIDKKLEEQINKQYNKQLDKLKVKPMEVPIPGHGKAKITISQITIHDLILEHRAIRIKATINGDYHVHLTSN